MEFDEELLKEFLNESWENLEKLDQDFVELEQNPSDPEIITRIFRVIHTMKGCSGLLGFEKLERISHYAEDILSQIREGTRRVEPEIVTKLLQAADALKEILMVVEETRSEGEGDYSQLIEELKRTAESGKNESPVPDKEGKSPDSEASEGSRQPARQDSEDEGGSSWEISIQLDESEKMPSIRALVLVERLGDLGRVLEVIPDVRSGQDLQEGELLSVLLSSDKTPEEIRGVLECQSVASINVRPVEEETPPSMKEPEPVSPVQNEPASKPHEAPKTPSGGSQPPRTVPHERLETSIRVDVDILEDLMNLVGELVLARNQILQYANSVEDPGFVEVTHRINLVTGELQETVMKTRMQPIANVFNRFPRMVRDMAADFGKQVDLRIEGKETELDRTLVEAIKDPMVHIIRNSMDHGIETPEERVKAGKPETGTLLIRAFHEGGQVNIQVIDDGAGVNVQRVKELAVERGLISQQQADAMSDKEATHLIFMPGFSTAQKVTAVSGRGVGMDVVRTNIEKIGGTVDIISEQGKGTTLTIRIPLTLAIIPALLVSNNRQRFAIPQMNVVELLYLEGEEIEQKIESVRGVQVYRLRGDLLPLIWLSDILGLERTNYHMESGYLYIVVLSAGNGQIGLIVDEVHDTEEIVVKPLSIHLKSLDAYAGATILGDGRIALILDVLGIVHTAGIAVEEIKEDLSEDSPRQEGFTEDLREILLFRLGADQQFAVPLGMVHRLEEFRRDSIEVVSGKEVVQYRGDLLPLIRADYVLSLSSAPGEESENLPVVVFSFEDRQVGLVVSEILDIKEVGLEFTRTTVSENGILGTAVVNGVTTQFLDIYSLLEMTLPEWFAAAPPADNFLEDKNVLLVDDSPFYRSMVRAYLDAAGFQTVEATNGKEALSLCERYRFDIILTDLVMPEMDGLELIQNLRDWDLYKDVPVVVLTARPGETGREETRKAGADAFLLKLNRGELLQTLKDLLTERKPS